MPDKHARLSASAAARWMHCPGSVALAERFPMPPPSSYAEEGTLAHALAELKLRYASGELSIDAFGEGLEHIEAEACYSGEMEEATDFYYNIVTEQLAAAGEGAELLVEQHFSLTDWVPEGFGTSDAVIIGGGAIEVIDLKYGKGVKVEAEGNPQLRLYGLGASALFGGLYDFDTVRTTIVQPRLDHVSREELPLSELLRWGKEEVAPRARLAMDNAEVYAAGDWCRFCPAKAVCRTRSEYNLELAKAEFREPPLLTDDEIGEVLRRAEALQHWAADVQDYTLKQALGGKRFDGWKLVEGRSCRKYADERKVAERLTAIGYDEALLYERKLLGITAMEKLIGKKHLAMLLGDLLVKPAGKPVLVPESDRRREISTAEAAKADFAEETPA